MSIVRQQIKRGTTSQWTTANPVLAAGEFGWDTTTGIVKLGDGATAWSSLATAFDVGDDATDTELAAHVVATGAHAATKISYGGSANLVATTVEAALDELAVGAGPRVPAARISPLPGTADGRYKNNVQSTSMDTVTTNGTTQYAVWANDSRVPTIAKRTIPNGAWSTFDLSTISGNPLGSPTATDLHNDYSVAVDSVGKIHVAGNHHGDSLRYVRSTNANDISAWTAPGMVGTEENLVTYPQFVRHPDGTLFFVYRNGSSGLGNTYVNKYNTGTGAWTRVCTLVDAVSESKSAYIDRHVIDDDGVWHISMTWTPEGGSDDDRNDLTYIRSADKGVTWTTVEGDPVTIPLTQAGAISAGAIALDTADSGTGLCHATTLTVDQQGRPHIATLLGATVRQLTHVWWTGTAWQVDTCTAWTEATKDYTHKPSHPIVLCPTNGRFYLGYRSLYDARKGAYWLVDITDPTNPIEFPILGMELREAEMGYDTRAMLDRNELTMLVNVANADAGSPRTGYWNADHWTKQFVGVLTIDCNQLDDLAARRVQVPRIQRLASCSAPNELTITQTSLTYVTGAGSIMTNTEQHGQYGFVRLSVRGSVSAGSTTLTVAVREAEQGGSSRTFGTLEFTGTSSATKVTPWMPLTTGPRNSATSSLWIWAMKSGAGNGKIVDAVLEYGVLAGPGGAEYV